MSDPLLERTGPSVGACKSQGPFKQRCDPHPCVGFRQIPQSSVSWGHATAICGAGAREAAKILQRTGQDLRRGTIRRQMSMVPREAGARSVMSHWNSTAWWGYRECGTRPCPLRGSLSLGCRWGHPLVDIYLGYFSGSSFLNLLTSEK